MSPYDQPEYRSFVREICSAPEDDTPRLVVADWLEERGEAARAEFIRVQVELAKMGPPHLVVNERCCVEGRGGPGYYSLTGGEGLRGGGLLVLEAKVGNRVDVPKPRGYKSALYGLRVTKLLDDEIILALDDKSGPWAGEALAKRQGDLWNYGAPGHWSVDDRFPFPYCIRCIDEESISKSNLTHDPIAIYRRGFVSHVTCTAADWIAHADQLYWHPGQKCLRCDGDGRVGGVGSDDTYDCSICHADGFRPFPTDPPPHPITEVTLKTNPNTSVENLRGFFRNHDGKEQFFWNDHQWHAIRFTPGWGVTPAPTGAAAGS